MGQTKHSWRFDSVHGHRFMTSVLDPYWAVLGKKCYWELWAVSCLPQNRCWICFVLENGSPWVLGSLVDGREPRVCLKSWQNTVTWVYFSSSRVTCSHPDFWLSLSMWTSPGIHGYKGSLLPSKLVSAGFLSLWMRVLASWMWLWASSSMFQSLGFLTYKEEEVRLEMHSSLFQDFNNSEF